MPRPAEESSEDTLVRTCLEWQLVAYMHVLRVQELERGISAFASGTLGDGTWQEDTLRLDAPPAPATSAAPAPEQPWISEDDLASAAGVSRKTLSRRLGVLPEPDRVSGTERLSRYWRGDRLPSLVALTKSAPPANAASPKPSVASPKPGAASPKPRTGNGGGGRKKASRKPQGSLWDRVKTKR